MISIKPLGPTFGNELIAAGLNGLPISWTAEGIVNRGTPDRYDDNGEVIVGSRLTAEQNATLDAVIAAHDPEKRPTTGEIDQDALNAALSAEGSVLRAFALLVLEDRNNMTQAVANATSLADLKTRFPKAITQSQFVALLKTKMRG